MKDLPIKLGPLALLLTVISICMTVLAILTFTTARADRNLSATYARTVQERYELEAEGQRFLQELKEIDPADLSLMDLERDAKGVYWTTLERDGAQLRIGFTAGREGIQVVAWRHEKEWDQDTGIGNLWNGF